MVRPRRFPIVLAVVRWLAASLLGALILPAVLVAQWSSDPAANLVLSDRSGEQVQPKIVATDGGGAYVSWFDNSDGGYDVYLQRLDGAGVEQWPHNGILVLDRGFSSTQDYGLDIDTAGNALLAFRDDSGTDVQITAARVSPQGDLLWGASGIQLTATTDFVAAPKIVGTSDGSSVVAWTQDTTTVAQKLDGDGMAQWGGGVVLTAATGGLSLSDLQPSNGGGVVLSFVQSGGGASPRHLWAQKLDAAGALLWGAGHVQVYDAGTGSLQFGNFPAFVTDGAGGAVFSWYTSSPSLQVRAQRVDASGTELFAHNGVEGSTDATRNRVSPAVAFDPTSQQTFLFWLEANGAQSQFGVWAQKLDAAGVRQWGDAGLEVVPLGNSQQSFLHVDTVADGARAVWIDSLSFDNDPIRGIRLDGAGAPVWDPAMVDLATSPSASSRLAGTTSSTGAGLYVWADDDTASNILGQNLNADGTLGPAVLFADGFESGDTSAWSGGG